MTNQADHTKENVFLAEKVEGWVRLDPYRAKAEEPGRSHPFTDYQWEDEFGGWHMKPPAYKTDPAAMLRLIEAMRKLGWYFEVLRNNSRKYEVSFTRKHPLMNKPNQGEASAYTLPEAVFNAALKALGWEGE